MKVGLIFTLVYGRIKSYYLEVFCLPEDFFLSLMMT